MGVEPTRDRTERPPNHFEDGEAHRDLYTSIALLYCPIIVKPTEATNSSYSSKYALSKSLANTLYSNLCEILYHQICLA